MIWIFTIINLNLKNLLKPNYFLTNRESHQRLFKFYVNIKNKKATFERK